MNRIEFAILTDLRKNFKPFGIWATDHKYFSHKYDTKQRDLLLGFLGLFTNFDAEKVKDWKDFWDYWCSTGKGALCSMLGPFVLQEDINVFEFTSNWVDDLEGLIKKIKKEKLPLAY